MKKRIVKLFSFLMAFSVCTTVSAVSKGDINGDGNITEKDIKSMYKYLWGTKELDEDELKSADINSDSVVNIADFVLHKGMFTESVLTDVSEPEFSAESGFYSGDFTVSLSAPEGCRIYYTTDGTVPTVDSTVYSGEIRIKNRSSEPNVYSAIPDTSHDDYVPARNVDKGTVVRAFCVDESGNASDIVTKTYFCGIDINQKYNGFPVLCVTADPDDLFGYENGIYVTGKVFDDWKATQTQPEKDTWKYPGNYTQRGEEWERKVFVELFENDGKLAHSQTMGTRITGNASRASMVKSLKFYSREEYGKKNVKYELIPEAKTEIDDTTVRDKYKRFTMRNGGNDLGYAQFRDNYIQSLVGDRAFETLSSRPAVMFINGEYWGVYALQEDYSDNYIENNYNIDKDNVIIIECGHSVDEGLEEDLTLYKELINFAKNNDLSISSNYEKISGMMDMQSFIDYYCTEIFIANQDWMNNNNNYRIWRSRTVTDAPYEDGKWRWMMYDTEFSLSLYAKEGSGTYTEDSLRLAMHGSKDTNAVKDHAVLFNKLLRNDDFKKRFVTTFSDLMNENLSQENMLSVLEKFEKMYSPVMEDHIYRTGPGWVVQWSKPVTSNFSKEIIKIKDFIQQRERYIYQFISNDLSLSGKTADIKISTNNVQGGSVQINTITPDLTNGWTGTYLTDYPVTITATANEGYKFAGWENSDETSPTITVNVSEGTNIQAMFVKE
ncbi:MAG: CotH kinase family protein [Oscillospiraceae bacterium]|nr:CotH kinase family protein [Oscillospiraceae bacterium]